MPALRRPEAIWLFSTPLVKEVASPVSAMFDHWIFRRMLWWRSGNSSGTPRSGTRSPSALSAVRGDSERRSGILGLNDELLSTDRDRSERVPELREFRRPVRIIFGDADPDLNREVARAFHELFPTSDLFLIRGLVTMSRWTSQSQWQSWNSCPDRSCRSRLGETASLRPRSDVTV